MVARRLAWGSFLNCGQTCIRPDYVLVQQEQVEPLVAELKKALESFYGEDPKKSEYLGRIVNERHFQRVSALLRDTKADVAIGGQTDAAERYVAPTVLLNVKPDDALMRGENVRAHTRRPRHH